MKSKITQNDAVNQVALYKSHGNEVTIINDPRESMAKYIRQGDLEKAVDILSDIYKLAESMHPLHPLYSYTPIKIGGNIHFEHTPANDIEALKSVVDDSVCAIMVEFVQGEGGVVPLDADFVRGVAKFAKENDILLIVDEVQTGNGRTGQLYAYMNYGIQPDIVSTAKGLGGGLPIGATLLGEKVEYTLGFGDHGSTYGGNPVCCAGAISVISRMDDAFLADVRRKSQLVFDSLSGAPGVKAVTGLGLMIGISTERPAGDIVRECMENGVLCLTAKDKVRLLPALNIPDEVLMKAVGIVKDACAK